MREDSEKLERISWATLAFARLCVRLNLRPNNYISFRLSSSPVLCYNHAMENRRKKRNTALAVTFGGIMAALGVGIMLAGGALGIATYAAPLLASACLIPVVREFGKGRAFLAFLAAAILSLFLCADKECAFFYVFIGYYPIAKQFFERPQRRFVRFLLKLILFAGAIGTMYLFLYYVLRLGALIEEFGEYGLGFELIMYALLVAVMLFYDRAVGAADMLYVKRIRPKLKFLDRGR